MSAPRNAGPRTALREQVPNLNAGAGTIEARLKNSAVLRCEAGNSGSAKQSGRCVAKPAKALKLVVWLTASGKPDCKDTIPATCHPLVSFPTAPLGWNLWLGPTGRS